MCEQKGVEVTEAEACPDHIHMLVSIPPHLSVAQFMGNLKETIAFCCNESKLDGERLVYIYKR